MFVQLHFVHMFVQLCPLHLSALSWHKLYISPPPVRPSCPTARTSCPPVRPSDRPSTIDTQRNQGFSSMQAWYRQPFIIIITSPQLCPELLPMGCCQLAFALVRPRAFAHMSLPKGFCQEAFAIGFCPLALSRSFCHGVAKAAWWWMSQHWARSTSPDLLAQSACEALKRDHCESVADTMHLEEHNCEPEACKLQNLRTMAIRLSLLMVVSEAFAESIAKHCTCIAIPYDRCCSCCCHHHLHCCSFSFHDCCCSC